VRTESKEMLGVEEAAFDRHLHFAARSFEVAEEALGKQREGRWGGGGAPSWSAGAFGRSGEHE